MKAEHKRRIPRKSTRNLEVSILNDTGGEVAANFAFKECFKCAEAREKLKKQVEQEKA